MGSGRILPQVDWVETFLTHRGWAKLGEGPAGSMWGGPDIDELAVPSAIANDHKVASSLISRISVATRLSFDEVFDGIGYGAADVIHLRVSGAGIGGGCIPWKSAEKIVRRGRDAFRAAGATAMGMKPEIKENYSRLSDGVVDDAQLAHTVDGSFGFPMIVRLPTLRVTAGAAARGGEPEGHDVEPIERRVTRTFAESLKAVHNLIAIRDPQALQMSDLPDWV